MDTRLPPALQAHVAALTLDYAENAATEARAASSSAPIVRLGPESRALISERPPGSTHRVRPLALTLEMTDVESESDGERFGLLVTTDEGEALQLHPTEIIWAAKAGALEGPDLIAGDVQVCRHSGSAARSLVASIPLPEDWQEGSALRALDVTVLRAPPAGTPLPGASWIVPLLPADVAEDLRGIDDVQWRDVGTALRYRPACGAVPEDAWMVQRRSKKGYGRALGVLVGRLRAAGRGRAAEYLRIVCGGEDEA